MQDIDKGKKDEDNYKKIISRKGKSFYSYENPNLISNVKLMERSELQLVNFEITYDKYKEITAPMLAEGFSNKEDEVIFGYGGKLLKGNDLIGLSIQEMLEHKKNLEEATKHTQGQAIIKNIQISDIYNDTMIDGKIIFTKTIVTFSKAS